MSSYTIFGTLNAVFILVSLMGVYSQLQLIWQRKGVLPTHAKSTAILSLNKFTVSYLAYLSFFVYGYSIEPFNHFIVWPRLIASVLVAMILWEIWLDRKTYLSLTSLIVVAFTLSLSLLGLWIGGTFEDEGRILSTGLILGVAVLIAQGYYHQIRLIIKSGVTGAVDLRMSQFILMMDISTIAFALSMGIQDGWPLMVLAITSGTTKLVIMYLFHWVKVSPQAKLNRAECG